MTLNGRKELGRSRANTKPAQTRAVVLACHGFTLSVHTMTGRGVSEAQLDAELAAMLEGYLQP